MKLILLSGGSGKRLWPLSNDARSKQFLKILDDGNGGMESMVQRVWRQLAECRMDAFSYILTNRGQREILRSQLGDDVPIIFEPSRRDTFPAVALGTMYMHDILKADPDEIICVMPVDPYVNHDYFEKLLELQDVIEASGAKLALMGVKPDHPSENYGYIVPKDPASNVAYALVERFVEKPKESLATELIGKHALWNCGVFAFRVRFLIEALTARGIPASYEYLSDRYDELEATSFDFAVVEKTPEIAVLPFDGKWKDLGTWDTLTEEIPNTVIGKGLKSESRNTHLINELDIPVTVLGISDAVVAASPDGILVADKAAAPRLKQMIGGLGGHPMYAERLWGWYHILDYTHNDSGFEVLTKRIGIHAGKNISYQVHDDRTEIWTVISGTGEIVLDGQYEKVGPGTSLRIPPGVRHAIKAETELEMIEVQMGRELIEEDIRREAMNWEEIGSAQDLQSPNEVN